MCFGFFIRAHFFLLGHSLLGSIGLSDQPNTTIRIMMLHLLEVRHLEPIVVAFQYLVLKFNIIFFKFPLAKIKNSSSLFIRSKLKSEVVSAVTNSVKHR